MVANWTFLTNHARVLLCIAHDPGVRLRDIAASAGITERSAYGIVTDLAEAGYIVKQKNGRRNRYQIQAHLPLPEPTSRERAVRYAALRHPEHAASISRVLAIPPKRWDRTIVAFLTEPETDALLAAPDRSTWTGRRDQALLLRDPKLPVHRRQGRHLLLRRPRHAHRRPPPGCPPKPDQTPAPDQLQVDNPLVPGERERHRRGGAQIPRADHVRGGARRGGRAPCARLAGSDPRQDAYSRARALGQGPDRH